MRFFVLLFLAAFISAQSSYAEDANMDEFCSTLGGVAKTIMTSRQLPVPMSDLLKNLPEDKDAAQTIRAMAIEAYEQPLFSTDENKKKAITEFANAIVVQCYKKSMK